MIPFLHSVITKSLSRISKTGQANSSHMAIEIEHAMTDALYIFIGVCSAAIGIEGFLIPSSFIDGGVMGISLIVNALTHTSLSLLIIVFNAPFLIMAFSAIGRRFAVKSIIGIVCLSLLIHFIPIPVITQDKILVAAFGGLFLGFGIGMAIRGGAIIDGTEVLAIYISRKTSLTVGNVILIFNILIFISAAFIFNREVALYAILTYFSASKTIDFVIDGIEEYTAVTIISDFSDDVRVAIISKLGRGCTIYKGKSGFSRANEPLEDRDIVYTIVTRLEMSKLKTEIDKVDPDAFIVMSSVKDAKGGMIKKKPISKIK
ncbi:YitT family protein [Flavobacteriaceae bacterium F08102]|nr:YitT family protein [Flavobacteriaceae bacterium F08102]